MPNSDCNGMIVVSVPPSRLVSSSSSPSPNRPTEDQDILCDTLPVTDIASTKEKSVRPRDYSPPAVQCGDQLRNDFIDFGFTIKEANALMAKHELLTDQTGQRPPGGRLRRQTNDVSNLAPDIRKRGISKTSKYEPLFLARESPWALFDPQKGFPSKLGNPPPIFERFAKFLPGNVRIVEYNIHSGSLRTRVVMDSLKDMVVDYPETGPKLVGMMDTRATNRSNTRRQGSQSVTSTRRFGAAEVESQSDEIELQESSRILISELDSKEERISGGLDG